MLHGGGLRPDGRPPLLNGFVSKWYIALAAVDTYQPLPIIGFGVLLVSALLTAIYMFQIAVRAWFPGTALLPFRRAPSMRRGGRCWYHGGAGGGLPADGSDAPGAAGSDPRGGDTVTTFYLLILFMLPAVMAVGIAIPRRRELSAQWVGELVIATALLVLGAMLALCPSAGRDSHRLPP